MRRAVLAAATLLLWPVLLSGQDTYTAGEVVTAQANHDGNNTVEYRLWALMGTQPVTRLVNGVISFADVVVPVGVSGFRVEALGLNGTAVSPLLPVTVIPQQTGGSGDPPTLGPCPYVNPQGVAVPKQPGDTSVHGYNPLDFSSVAARQAHADRVKQLVAWGFSVREFPDFARGRVLMFAVCHGVPVP